MKVAINACFGGFGLSRKATRMLAARKGRECYWFSGGLNKPYVRDDDDAKDSLFATAFDVPEVPQEPSNEWYKEHSLYLLNELPRDDADLIAVIEELGDGANGSCARLRIVEIPDGVEWEIDEYDGNEHIAETHRRWS